MHRLIYWSASPECEDEVLAYVHILDKSFMYTNPTMAEFNKLIEELRKTFPQATEDSIFPSRITIPNRVESSPEVIRGKFNIIKWVATIPRGDYHGWTQITGKPTYE